MFRHLLERVIGGQLQEQFCEESQLRGIECYWRMLDDPLEGGKSSLALLITPRLLRLIFLLLTLLLLPALLGLALLLGLIRLTPMLELSLACLGLFLRFLFQHRFHHRSRVLGFLLGKPGGGIGIMHRALGIGADGDGLPYPAPEDDQSGVGTRTRRLGIGIVGQVEHAIGAPAVRRGRAAQYARETRTEKIR